MRASLEMCQPLFCVVTDRRNIWQEPMCNFGLNLGIQRVNFKNVQLILIARDVYFAYGSQEILPSLSS